MVVHIVTFKFKEEKIPDVNGDKEILDLREDQKETQPPKRYSPASIVSELEKRNLGTKATRAQIIDSLYQRGYIINKQIEATTLGKSVVDVLLKYSPEILDEELTRKIEEEMEDIRQNKKQPAKILSSAKKELTKEINSSKEKITKSILQAFSVSTKEFGWFNETFIQDAITNFVNELDQSYNYWRIES